MNGNNLPSSPLTLPALAHWAGRAHAGAVALGMVGPVAMLHTDSWILATTVTLASMGWWYLIGYHSRTLCEQCFVLPQPTGPQLRRALVVFRWYHRWAVSGRSLLLLLGAVGIAAGWSWILWKDSGTAAVSACVTAVGVSGWQHYTTERHDRLVVWCPWCRGDDPGHADSPDPTHPKRLPA